MAGYSNLDHTWDDGAKEAIDAGLVMTHSAWHFNGKIALEPDEGLYVEKVYRYGTLVDVIASDDLDDLVKTVCDQWGWE